MQGGCAKLDTFSITGNIQRSQKSLNCIFGPPYVGIRGKTSALYEGFN